MKYENFIEFFSSLDADNNEINSRWEELSKKKRKASLITLIIILNKYFFVKYLNTFSILL